MTIASYTVHLYQKLYMYHYHEAYKENTKLANEVYKQKFHRYMD